MGYFIHEDQPAGLPLANLDELNDANISSPADKDVLSYDATSQKWVNDSSINSNILNRAIIKTYTFTCIPTTSSPNYGVYNYWWSDYFNISDIFGVNEGTAVLLSAANLNDFGRMPQVELLQNPTSLLRVAVRSVNNTDTIKIVLGIIC